MTVNFLSLKNLALLLIPLAAIVPWAMLQFDIALNTNHAWLGIAAQRLLDGGTMSADFYDPNPPLSIIAYIPHILLSRLSGIPYYYMPAAIGLALLALSTAASGFLLSRIRNVSADQHIIILTACLLATTYLGSNWYFADRDALVIWGLFPFLLGQYALTRRDDVPRTVLWPVFMAGAVLVLVKPHYGIFPVLMLAHRAAAQKRAFGIIKDPDFLCLAGATLGYAAICAAFFPDYLALIAAEMRLYVGLVNPATPVWTLLLLGVVALAALMPPLIPTERGSIATAKIFLLGALICLGLYFIQMKGFFYHLIPFMTFFFCAAGFLILGVLQIPLKKTACATAGTVALMTLLALLYAPPDYRLIRHADYRKTALGKLAEQCAPDCGIFIISQNMETAIQVSTYTGATWASRYPVLWWLPKLHPDYRSIDDEAAEAALRRHMDNVAADIERYRPSFIAVILNSPLFATQDKRNFDYMAFLNGDPATAAVLAPYRLARVIEDNSLSYFYRPPAPPGKPFIYAIYERDAAPPAAGMTNPGGADITAP